tara:strand:+ start:170 stop:520 length:351 start_codon:yes stop_codon:yes gene_type:complete
MNRDTPLPSDANKLFANLNKEVTKNNLTRVRGKGRRGSKTTTWNLTHGGTGEKVKSFDSSGNKTVTTTRVNRHGDEKTVTKKYKRGSKNIYNIPFQKRTSRKVDTTPNSKVIKAKY